MDIPCLPTAASSLHELVVSAGCRGRRGRGRRRLTTRTLTRYVTRFILR